MLVDPPHNITDGLLSCFVPHSPRLSCICPPLTLASQVRVMLSRASHRQEGFALRGSAVRAYTPYNPVARDESWYFFLVEPNNNAVWAWTKVGFGSFGGGFRVCGQVCRVVGRTGRGLVLSRLSRVGRQD